MLLLRQWARRAPISKLKQRFHYVNGFLNLGMHCLECVTIDNFTFVSIVTASISLLLLLLLFIALANISAFAYYFNFVMLMTNGKICLRRLFLLSTIFILLSRDFSHMLLISGGACAFALDGSPCNATVWYATNKHSRRASIECTRSIPMKFKIITFEL